MSFFPFHLLADYSSIKTLIMGLALFFSLIGTGMFLFERAFGKRVPSRFSMPIAALLGLHVYSLLVQIAGFCGFASPVSLRWLLFTQIFVGCFLFCLFLRAFFNRIGKRFLEDTASWKAAYFCSKSVLLLSFVLLISLTVNLIISLAPSTKFDEMFYHMLLPLRIVQDHAIHYYSYPAHIFLPHMHYQLAAAPFYAIGLPDAMNPVSWALSVMFVFFAFAVLIKKTKSIKYSLFITLGLYVGMHSPVWYVTGNSASLTLLGMTLLIWMVLDGKILSRELGDFRLLGMISFLSMSAASSKLNYVPLAILCLAIFSFIIWHKNEYRKFFTIFAIASSFWVIFYLPAVVWSWSVSGYIMGPLSDPNIVAGASAAHRSFHGIVYQLAIAVADLTPFVWGGVFLFLFLPWIRKTDISFVIGTALFCVQAFLILWKMPLVYRYFGGVHFALSLYFWTHGTGYLHERFAHLVANKKLLQGLLTLCIAPWLFLQLWYSAQFLPVVFGAKPATAFAERLIPFYEDFRKLDKLLPEDAVLWVRGFKMPVYAPRRILYEKNELEYLEKPYTLFFFTNSSLEDDEENWSDYTYEPVYHNEAAKVLTFRTPGRAPALEPLKVYLLEKSAGTEVKE